MVGPGVRCLDGRRAAVALAAGTAGRLDAAGEPTPGRRAAAADQKQPGVGKPSGDERWTQDVARRLGLEFTLNRRGRPSMQAAEPGKR